MAAFDDIASAIVAGQQKVVGPLAIAMANRVTGLTVSDSGAASVSGDGVAAIEGLVREYSGLTGKLGVKMCYQSAEATLNQHPDIIIPMFAAL